MAENDPDQLVLNGQQVRISRMHAGARETVTNGVRLEFEQSLGYPNKRCSPYLLFYNEERAFDSRAEWLLIPTGRRFVGHSVRDGRMRFLGPFLNSRVTVIGTTVNKGVQIVAFAERKSPIPTVIVSKMVRGRPRVLQHSHLPEGSKFRIIQITFSPSNCCVTLAGSDKEKVLTFFNVKTKSVVVSKVLPVTVSRVSFNKTETSEFVGCGKGNLRLYHRLESSVDDGKEIEGLPAGTHNFVDAQFFPEKSCFVSVTEERLCFIVESGRCIRQFPLERSPVVRATFRSNEEELKDEACFDAQLSTIPNGTKDRVIGARAQEGKEKKEEEEVKEEGRMGSLQKPACLAVAAGHFAVGWTFGGLVSLYEVKQVADPAGDKFEANLTRIFTVGDTNIDILSLAFNHNEECLAIASGALVGSNYLCPITKRSSIIFPTRSALKDRRQVQCYFVNIPQLEAMQAQALCPVHELLEKGNTFGALCAVSVSYCKSYVATAGADRVVRIWECSDQYRFTQILAQRHNCELFDLSLHPTATQLAIGTSEGLKVCYIIAAEELKMAIDISGKSSFAVHYSNGGNFLAAGFGSQVLIVDAATLETKYVLGQHRSSVLCVSWSDSDAFMCSACKGGSIFVWGSRFELHSVSDQHLLTEVEGAALKALQATNKYEFARLNVPIVGLVYDDEYDLLITLGADKVLEVLSDHAANQYFYYKFEAVAPTCIFLSKQLRVLFIGLANGSVRTILWPPMPKSTMDDYHDFQIHAKDVMSVKVSHDLKHLVSVDKDGIMVVMKMTEVYEGLEGLQGSPDLKRRKGDTARLRPHDVMDSLCLTYRRGIKDKQELIGKLQQDKKNIYDQGIEKEAVLGKTHDIEIAEIMSEHNKLMEEERLRYRGMQEQYEAECKNLELQRLRLIEENNAIIENMGEQNRKEQRTAFDMNNKKIELIERQRAEFRTQVDFIQNYLKEQLGNIESTYQGKYDELRAQHNELLEKINMDGINFDEALEQCEIEYEKEIEENKKVANVNEKKAALKFQELQKEHETLFKELKELNEQMLLVKEQKANVNEQLERAREKKAVIDVKVKELEEKLKEEQVAILRKESELKEIKAKNSNLDNLKCILDHKIWTLGDEKEPMENQIRKLEEQVQKMHKDLEREAEIKKTLDEELRNLNILAKDAETRKKGKAVEVENMRRRLLVLQHDLICVLEQPITDWPGSLDGINSKYFKQKELWSPEETTTLEKEYFQIKDELVLQKQWLEDKLKSIKGMNTLKEQEKGVATKIMEKENTGLIDDSNKLRNEYEVLKCKVSSLEDKYKSLKKLIASLPKSDNPRVQIKKYMEPMANRGGVKPSQMLTERRQKTQKRSISIMSFRKTAEEQKAPPDSSGRIGKLIDTLKDNKETLESQNKEMAQLQEKVSQFLISNSKSAEKGVSEELVSPVKCNKGEERKGATSRDSASVSTASKSKRTMYSSSSRKNLSNNKQMLL